MKPRAFIIAAAAVLVTAASFAGETGRWLNVHVTDRSDATEVKVHLPFSMVLTLVDAIETEEFRNGKVHIDIDDAEVDWPAILAELRNAPEGEYLTVDQEDAHVVMSKKDGLVLVDVKEAGEDGDTVQIRLQEPLLSAFTVDEEDRIDVRALLAGLERIDGGDLIRVDSRDAYVRVWVE